LRALAINRLPGSLADKVLRQINTESGGNARAVQGNIGDINNRTGNLARGLMQVIPPTFRAYHVPGTSNDIFDPLANIAAGINYDMHKFGGNPTLRDLGQGHGYDSGGWLMPGTTLAYNQTGRPEAILTSQQWDAITSLAGGSGRTGPLVETAIIREMADVDLLAAQLDHRQRVGGF
jgi:SLT domain-containing protein